MDVSSFLRRISTQRLLATCAAVLVLAGTGAALALAAVSGGPVPERKPLANAVHDAITAPEVDGVTARIEFTNHLVDNVDFAGWNPIIGGGTGRLWATDDGRFRLELQSSGGDAQVVSDGKEWWAYDGESETVYRGRVPEHHEKSDGGVEKEWRPPTVARIQRVIDRVMRKATIDGPTPTNIGGEPAYTVRTAPKRYGGLLGAMELGWSAAHGTPLRAAIYAKGESDPVLALEATEVEFGKVPAATFEVPPPSDTKVERVRPHDAHDADHQRNGAKQRKHREAVTGLARVERRTGFDVSAPEELEGRKRQSVVLLGRGKGPRGALVTYGRGLDGIAVIQKPATAEQDGDGPLGSAELPTVALDGAVAEVLTTPLGTVLRFERDGVRYVVLASAERSVVVAAARGL